MNEIEVRPAALAIQPGQEMFDAKQKAALVSLGIKDASPADLAVFMHYAQKTQLDPFSRQIYLIGRNVQENGKWVTKQTIQVGIDGLRVVRDRIARQLGIPVEYEDTVWYDADGRGYHVWLGEGPPFACVVTVLKDGKRFPGVVRYSAYMQTTKDGKPNSMWARMGAEQLEKCAEAKALRRAFPNDLSGIYIPEEMSIDGPPRPHNPPRPVTLDEINGAIDVEPSDDPVEWPDTAQPPDSEVTP